jgi:hypothetical protein
VDVTPLRWVLLTLAVSALGLVAHRLLLWMERRGWIYYRRKDRPSMGAAALFGLNEVFHPQAQHTVVEQQQQDTRGARRAAPDEPEESPPRRSA